jgi:hypothetical protein
MIACGEAQGGSPSPFGAFSQLLNTVTAPMAYGGPDVDLITGADSISHPTQSETYTLANPDNPNQIVVTYNDSRTASATILEHRIPATAASPSPVLIKSLLKWPWDELWRPGYSLQQTY